MHCRLKFSCCSIAKFIVAAALDIRKSKTGMVLASCCHASAVLIATIRLRSSGGQFWGAFPGRECCGGRAVLVAADGREEGEDATDVAVADVDEDESSLSSGLLHDDERCRPPGRGAFGSGDMLEGSDRAAAGLLVAAWVD
jgi:putative intracellular protease/amidase